MMRRSRGIQTAVAVLLAGSVVVAGTSVDPGRPASAGTAADTNASAGQPYAPHWFPADLLEWAPQDDPDAEFNRSTVPLADRVVDEHTAAAPDAEPRGLMALSVFANTSGNRSQGSADFDYYTSEFWPYIETLVFWGGSAGEGLILAPNPTVTDAAHANGVPVYGTVFLPPEVYGGDLEWTRQLVARDDSGGFPVADKLVEVADYYGFDGWFVNAETEGGDAELATGMIDFLVELRSLGTGVIWYDAMIIDGRIAWQNRLNELNAPFFAAADSMFVNYHWNTERLASSAAYAGQLGREPHELYAGIDVGWRQFDVQPSFDVLFPTDEDATASGLSVALYRPDFTLTGTDDPAEFADRESRFWVGANGDPSRPDADEAGWRGVSGNIAEHAVLTGAPFVTYFNTGHGTSWWHDGERWQAGPWNNLSAQDVLPTWRWVVDGAPLEIDYDYDLAYQGGSSIRIDGRLDEPTTIELFAGRLRIEPRHRIALTTTSATPAGGAPRAAATRPTGSLVLRFVDQPDIDVEVPIGRLGTGRDGAWRTASRALAPYAGRTLIDIALRLEHPEPAGGEISVHLGGFGLLAGKPGRIAPPTDVEVAPDGGDGARVTWAASPSAPARYSVEAVDAEGARTWLGVTSATAFYVPLIPAGTVRVEVVPVGDAGQRGAPGVG